MALLRFVLKASCVLLLIANTIGANAEVLETRAADDIKQFSGTADQIANFDPHDYVPSYYWRVRVAHAAMMAAVWLVIFPIGGMIPRLRPGDTHLISFHAILQMVGFWIVVAAAGLGIWMAKEIDQFGGYHPLIGLILLVLVCMQPAMELINHRFYHVDRRVGYLSHVHIWLGRILLVAGVVQGGLGFLFAASFKKADTELWPRIAYGLVAAIMWVIYMIFGVVYPEVKGAREREALKEREELSVIVQQPQRTPSTPYTPQQITPAPYAHQHPTQYAQQQGVNDFLYAYSGRHYSQV